MLLALLTRNGVNAAGKRFPIASLTVKRAFSRSMSTPLLLSPSQLQQLLLSESPTDSATKQISILDSSWFMPNSPRKANEEFQEKRIPGAQFLDLDEVSSPHDLGLKHMIPSERHFTDVCEEFGIDPTSHVILYDTHGVFSSPRALFMFRAFGHEKSSVLDGGLPRWEAEGFPIEAKPPVRARKSVYPTPVFDKGMIRSYDQMVSNSFTDLHSDSAVELVVDARSRGRFLGTESEPRAGLSSGHIPHSFSLPFTAFLQTRTIPNSSVQYSTFLSLPELRNALVSHVGDHAEAVIQGKRPITTSCGSGMTAGVLWLGLKLLGVQNVALYDESWTGYASRASSKIEKAAN
ncbi:Rhodanese-like domain-containing protein [Suillus discolor]|uniref:Rhodanese-like domain-containing protein n=1 Tax=Suillus discolor TaxID=1912936 RepID=A0A9P7F933_9AGAM|nr:Rhodanese-like domain-containing protein [Suillus discolor]KAG2109575.1 Rhodanese-like domain-containing protein [Suillus discolor]